MTEATTHPDDLIQAELEAITGFSDALSALWNEFETRQLFTEPLPSLEREAASELLHQGKPLCLTLPPPDAACCRDGYVMNAANAPINAHTSAEAWYSGGLS